ncbi:hypothetical protein BGZ92_008188 [Podila epicladia]|nr:hypothetical protein BGZ92_008188 [Podila epicladia]
MPSVFTSTLVAVGSLALAGLAQADIMCTQFGADTFRIGSMLKFQWNDTQSTSIETFNLGLYCATSNKLLQTIATLNLTSPSPYPWVVNSSITAFSTDCPLNQYQGGFNWQFSDPETGAAQEGVSKCKIMLLVGTGASNAPSSPGSSNGVDPNDEEPQPTEIVITDKTKSIVIGVGCAVGALVLAGVIGFYFIRYSNKRAEQENSARKLREPIQSGPLFSPMDRSGGGGGAHTKYNELSSITTGSIGYSPTTTAKTEMADLSGYNKMGNSSPAFGSRSPTPIAAAHAGIHASSRMGSRPSTPTPISAAHSHSRAASPAPGSPTPIAALHSKLASPTLATSNGERPTSLLTSSYVPAEEASSSRAPSPASGRNPFEQKQYEQQMQLQQQQQQTYGYY